MRTVTISAISGDWTLGISLAAATASDTLGEQAAAAGPSGTFNVDNTAPTTVLTEPADGSTFRGNGVTLTATATDVGGTGVAGVEFLIDGQNLGFNTAPTSVDVTITSTTAVGAYQVTIGYDPNILKLIPSGVTGGTGAGFTGTPTVVNIDNTAGTVTINAFQTGNSPTGTFTVANLAFIPLSDGTSNLSLVVNVLTDTLSIDLTIPPRRLR